MKKKLVLLLTLTIVSVLTACAKSTPSEEHTQAETPEEVQEETPAVVEVEDVLSETGSYASYTYSDHVLNEKGQVISRKVRGNSNRTDTFEYDEQGRVVKNIRTSSYGEELYTYTYDENGMLIEEFQGDRTFAITYTFDDQNRVATQTKVNQDGGYTMVYSYTYNEDGTVATETQTSETSTWVLTFTYDEKGRVIAEEAVKDEDGSHSYTSYTYGVVGTYTPAE